MEEMQREAQERLQKLVEQSNIQPVTAESLRSMGGVWPDDEDLDDFLLARERARKDAPERQRVD